MKKLIIFSILALFFSSAFTQSGKPGSEFVVANWTPTAKDTTWSLQTTSANYVMAVQVEWVGLNHITGVLKIQTKCSKCARWVTESFSPADTVIATSTNGQHKFRFLVTEGFQARLSWTTNTVTTGTSIKAWQWFIQRL